METDKVLKVPFIAADFKCEKCGARLGVRPKISKEVAGFTNEYDGSFDQGASGYAATFTLEVTPCRTCIDQVIAPAKALTDAIIAMTQNG